MAEPQPKVLNLASTIFPSSSTFTIPRSHCIYRQVIEKLKGRVTSICSFMTSPQAGAPTRPVPTLFDLGSILPTFLWHACLRCSNRSAGEGGSLCDSLRIWAPGILIVVDHFLVIVGHRDPEKYCATKRFSQRLTWGDTHLAMLIMDWVSLRLCLRSAILASFFLVHNSEKSVGFWDSCCIMHCKFELEVNARLGLNSFFVYSVIVSEDN